ncbi:N-acetylmuramoyl-L-alanine amidase family protein [Clostridium sp. 'White wine YQ']|uniref:N-acetylmuramoyl-L-alanine amidase family protein n=1 Tax=Clostridium sp. 'White wine YQ' TaxID=3027474 RepID=UPI0023668E12|nr:N-acetylmuramoyl-L-alanine amidase [Clostridium sp. 'White wine YQ']MDD7792869.1 N-acetylmuramoyl-L-alanine amidase [Clostridium sp. 'White wine YQ']
MKKLILGILCIIILFSLSSCKDKRKEVGLEKQTDEVEITNEETKTLNENVKEENKDIIKDTPVIKKKVVIDPGHSSNGNREQEKISPDSNTMKIKDPGGAQGVVTGTPEYVVTMDVSLKLKALLEQNQVEVIMTKTQDIESPGNIERAEIGNNNNANLTIRIHCDSVNSRSVKGASMLVPAPIGYAKDISTVSRKYGETILNDLIASAGMSNRGISERSDLTGFNWSKVPVVLVEMGFMSNPEEDKLLSNQEYQNKLAEGLCNGILHALNN